MKLKRPKDWPPPPPPEEEIVEINAKKPQGPIKEDKISLGWLKYIWSGGDPKHWDHSIPDKPNTTPPPPVGGYVPTGEKPFNPPPSRPAPEKDWSYEIVSDAAHNVTDKLNYYKEKKRLRDIVSMTATDNTTTILLEVYHW